MKLIKLSEEHYVLTDDSEIKKGDWVVSGTKTIVQCMYPENVHHEDIKKITRSTQPIEYEVVDVTPTGDAIEGYVYDKIQELSLSEVKELLGVVDVEKKAKYYYGQNRFTREYEDGFMLGFKLAYNQALEDNKEKKYTEKDMQWALHEARYHQQHTIEEIIEALHQPQTEWEVEIVDGKLKLK